MLRVTFINVGYGEAILLECPGGAAGGGDFTMLIDGGSAEEAEYAGGSCRIRAVDYLKKRGISKLDLVVNTHIHEDHTSGLVDVFSAMQIGVFWCNLLMDPAWPPLAPALATSESSGKFLAALNDSLALCRTARAAGIPQKGLQRGNGPFALCDGLSAEVLAPTNAMSAYFTEGIIQLYAGAGTLPERRALLAKLDAEMNNASVALRLTYGGARLLLGGDTNGDGLLAIAHGQPGALTCEVFKLGHHGQRDSLSAELLQAAGPQVAVVCADSGRKYQSTHPEVLALLAAHGEARGEPVQVLFSDSPEVPPYTNGLAPHCATVVEVGNDGALSVRYELPQ